MRLSDFPYVVEIAVPERGLPGRVAMYYFHAREDIQPHVDRHKCEKDGRRYIRWRFADFTTATKFAHQFGGLIVMGR
jgi:hypothetical protein